MQLSRLSRSGSSTAGGGRDRAKSVALAALCLLLFLTFLDNTVVSAACRPTCRRPSRNCNG